MFNSLGSLRRTTLLRYALVAVLMLFVVRLFYLQVIRHSYYANRAYQTQVSKLSIIPERGKIYALDGQNPVPLVLNETVYTAFVDPHEVTDVSAVIGALSGVIGGKAADLHRSALSDTSRRYVVVAKNLTRSQAENLRNKKLAGLGLQKGSRRVYPEGQLAAQALGYVNNDGKGQYGLEEALDTQLAGKPGVLQTVTDVRQIPLTIGEEDTSQPSVNGTSVVLSIDRTIQQKTEEILRDGLVRAQATRGSVVVMDPQTGRVMAMANYPTYDAGNYTKVEDYRLFQNGIISDPYEVGSVMKVLSMGAGLDTGAVTANSTYNNTGSVQVEDRLIKNVEEDPIYPGTTMTDVLRYSLNTGVVYVLQQMGNGAINATARQSLYDYYANHYRFGRLTGIEQAGETKGIVIPPNDPDGPNVRYANMTFGQGLNLTMIQTAAAFSAAMNGGTYYQPTVVRGTLDENQKITDQAPKVIATNVIKPDVSATLQEMTYQGRKQGFFGNIDPAGYRIGGKTGTSQVIDPATGEYSDENSIGSYLGFGGADSPRYVIMVRVDDSKLRGGYAGTIAAGPIFNDLSNWLLKYLEIPPKT